MEFNEIEWHDSVLKDIQIDRSKPGYKDIVKLVVITKKETRLNLIFESVYRADLQMNFNIIAEETIRSAEMRVKDKLLSSLIKKWKVISQESNNIKLFEINANSTNSTIRIYALRCLIENYQ